MGSPLRAVKVSLTGAMGVLLLLIVFNNVTDYETNFEFVSHVLQMDTTLRHRSVMWRAIDNAALHHLAFALIILWEAAACLVCLAATYRLARAFSSHAAAFEDASRLATIGLTSSMLLWLFAFLIVGGEWFLMWQSPRWNGQASAFRMFAISAIGVIAVALPDRSR